MVLPRAEEMRLRLSAVPPTTCPIRLWAPRAIPSANSSGPSMMPWKGKKKIPFLQVEQETELHHKRGKCPYAYQGWLIDEVLHSLREVPQPLVWIAEDV